MNAVLYCTFALNEILPTGVTYFAYFLWVDWNCVFWAPWAGPNILALKKFEVCMFCQNKMRTCTKFQNTVSFDGYRPFCR